MSEFEQLLDEAFGVKELKKVKTKLKRTSVSPPGQTDGNNTPPIPKVSQFADKPGQSAYNMQ